MLNIGPRLLCAASMVRSSHNIVDIGTDHAYLPAYLILEGKAEDVLACDIGINPLRNAENTVRSLNLQEQVKLRISDGLAEVAPEEAEEIIICGMGGNLISDILSAAPWIKRDGMHLILQPMTHSEDVRCYLYNNGFIIDDEKFVIDNKKVYCCISATFDGNVSEPDPGFLYFGFLPENDAYADIYAKSRIHRVITKLDALIKADPDNAAICEPEYLKNYFEQRKHK